MPKWDVVPTGKLGIRIDTSGGSFWGSSWIDRDDRPLEDALAQILQEMELRHDTAVDRRLKEEQQRIEWKSQWKIAREEAIQELTDSHRADMLAGQVALWRGVAIISEYAGELEQRALTEPDDVKRAEALEWAQWARAYADRTDPFRRRIRLPAPPEVTHAALQPLIGSWSAYRPESTIAPCYFFIAARRRSNRRNRRVWSSALMQDRRPPSLSSQRRVSSFLSQSGGPCIRETSTHSSESSGQSTGGALP